VIAPHPDDETCGCAGTLLLHQSVGDDVCIALVTDGRRSRALGLTPHEMADRRKAEAMQTAALLDITNVEWFGLPEGEWSVDQLVTLLVPLLGRIAPHVIYVPSRIDFHPEHLKVAHGIALALGHACSDATIRIYPVQVPLASVVNLVTDVSRFEPQIIAALQAYATQRASTLRTLRMRRYTAARHGLRGLAEEFCELGALAYVRMHEAAPDRWRRANFRSVLIHPWTDPLAYLVGAAERTRILRRAL
jgi:LmbE family N-acetylglucosaminyl deacetylase